MDVSGVNAQSRMPEAILPYPDGLWDRVKYHFWKWAYPLHNHVRDFLLKAHLITPPYTYRQNYVIGRLARGKKMADFLEYLNGIDFRNHFIAWEDSGQVASLRRLVDFKWQYHLRIFKDGEIRGHYELTPESHPLKHYKKMEQEPRREDFLMFLGDWVTPVGCVGGACEIIAATKKARVAASAGHPRSRTAVRSLRGRKRQIKK